MMKNIMYTILTGRLSRAPELKYLSSGMAVAKLSICCNGSKKSGDSWEDVPNFFELVAWGKTAEHLNDKCVKGQHMTFTCEPKQERWEEDGKTRSKVSFTIQSYEYGEKPRGGAQEGQSNYHGLQGEGQRHSAPAQQQGGYSGGEDPNDFPDDIPF